MKIIKHIATIKEWKNVSIELNLIEWKDGKPQYDLRKWEGDTPLKGVSLRKEDLITLYDAISGELEKEKIDSEKNDIVFTFGIKNEEYALPFPINDESSNEDLPFKSFSNESEKEEEDSDKVLDYRNVIVHDKFDECIIDGHDYEDVDAIVPVYKSNGVEDITVKARHCKTCGAYYISQMTYTELTRNGTILCKVVTKKQYNQFIKNKSFENLDFQSILAITGYNVNAQNNLSESCRHTILNRAIDDGIYTKQKAIKHIGFLINLNENKKNMVTAVEKWKRDRQFLIGEQVDNTVKIKGIIKKM